jgi:hypothetical protein
VGSKPSPSPYPTSLRDSGESGSSKEPLDAREAEAGESANKDDSGMKIGVGNAGVLVQSPQKKDNEPAFISEP